MPVVFVRWFNPSTQKCYITSVMQSSALSTLNSLVDNHFECSICLDTFSDPNVIPECLHHFCDACIKGSIQQCSKECPNCRARITSRRDLRKNHLVGNIVSKFVVVIVVTRLVLPCEEQLLLSSCVVSFVRLLLLIMQSPGEQSSQRNQITGICYEHFAAEGIRQ